MHTPVTFGHTFGVDAYTATRPHWRSPQEIQTLDSTATIFDGFMNAAGMHHRTAQLAQANDDIIGFVVANNLYEHCLDMAWSFDPINNYSPAK